MLGSSMAGEAMARAGLDFVVIDFEHGVFDYSQLVNVVRAVQLGGSSALVRVSELDSAVMLRVLETAPDGLLVAHVDGIDTARAVIDEALYPPSGRRGMSPYTRVHGFTHEGLDDSVERANTNLFIGILLEGADAMESVEALAQLGRLDLIYFGIYDFAQSVGCGDDLQHPDVQKALQTVAETCDGYQVACGTFTRTTDEIRAYRRLGVRFIAHGADGMILREGFERVVRSFAEQDGSDDG